LQPLLSRFGSTLEEIAHAQETLAHSLTQSFVLPLEDFCSKEMDKVGMPFFLFRKRILQGHRRPPSFLPEGPEGWFHSRQGSPLFTLPRVFVKLLVEQVPELERAYSHGRNEFVESLGRFLHSSSVAKTSNKGQPVGTLLVPRALEVRKQVLSLTMTTRKRCKDDKEERQ
jgi:hypothetical protein